MQDQGPFHDEPPPTEEELAAARALADELDGARPPSRGSLAETALAARAAVRDEPPLDRAIVRRGVDEGLARRRRTSRAVAFTALAAAAIAVAGLVIMQGAGILQLAGSGGSAGPTTSPPIAAPALTALRIEPFPDGQRTSERVDRMARLAASDWWADEVAAATRAQAPCLASSR